MHLSDQRWGRGCDWFASPKRLKGRFGRTELCLYFLVCVPVMVLNPNSDRPRSIQSQDHLTSKDYNRFIQAEALTLRLQKCVTTHASKKSRLPFLGSFLNKIDHLSGYIGQ
jgi:hypothetical protein